MVQNVQDVALVLHVGSVVEQRSAVVYAVGTIQLVGEFLNFLRAVFSLDKIQRKSVVSASEFSLIILINLGLLLIHGFQGRAWVFKHLRIMSHQRHLLLLHSRERRLPCQVHGLVVG